MPMQPTERSIARIGKLVDSYTVKTGTTTHPNREVTEGVVLGLANHLDKHKRPLCPCRYYPNKEEELKHRTWICPCDDMQIYKYCHCLLFVRIEGLPITEHLPPGHEGRNAWGEVPDPAPDRGRPLRHKAAEREVERRERPS